MLMLAPGLSVLAADGQIDILWDGSSSFTISTPGSYVLVENVTMSVMANGITIAAGVNDVTIDLNGHAIIGTSSGTVDGIAGATCARLRVFDGAIRGFGGDGIQSGPDAHIHDVVVSGNGRYGINASSNTLIESCLAQGNNLASSFAGIKVDGGSTVRNCVTADNAPLLGTPGAGRGIQVLGNGCRIEANTCSGNLGGSSFAGDGAGIDASTAIGATILHNVCINNSAQSSGFGRGIYTGAGATIIGNLCYGNLEGPGGNSQAVGIAAGPGSTIIGNVCRGNSAQGSFGDARGIAAGDDCVLKNNVCTANTSAGAGSVAAGISVTNGCTVEYNHAVNHSGGGSSYGIYVITSDNLIRSNTTSLNATSGIRLDGSGNRTELNRTTETGSSAPSISAAAGNSLGTGDLADLGF
jgi:hypothetical protein